MKTIQTDVLVIGSGFAGIVSATCAAESGANVTLVTESHIFSGSTFGNANFGFGIIGPENENDVDNLVEQICTVGRGMAQEPLVRTLASRVVPTVMDLKRFNIHFEEPKDNTKAEFIPCFDRKHRNFHLFNKKHTVERYDAAMTQLGVCRLPFTEVLRLEKRSGMICGAFALSRGELVYISCKAVILASGGLSSLYRYRYGNKNISVMGQYLALSAGARLTNIEFMQFIPGYIDPFPGTITNERTYKYCQFKDPVSGQVLSHGTPEEWNRALEIRSTHGPFTTELPSRALDILIFKTQMATGQGITLHYNDVLKTYKSEFMDHYFIWLRETLGLTMDDDILIGTYYHASNGGICINERAETCVPGLFACGEATSGMHGADRVGGMSMANCLTFGTIAGRNAAAFAADVSESRPAPEDAPELFSFAGAGDMIRQIQDLTFSEMSICRTGHGLCHVRDSINVMQQHLEAEKKSVSRLTEENYPDVVLAKRLESMLPVVDTLARAMELRKESRGSHYREDYPAHAPDLDRRLTETMDGNKIIVEFEK